MTMHSSPSKLSEKSRNRIAQALNEVLADGLDLHGQIKVAHWNIKGRHFAALHPLFETFALGLAIHNDDIAERAVTLGALAYGTARHVAKSSRLTEYPQQTTADLDHARLLADRFETYLAGVHAARALAAKLGDDDTVDLLTAVIREFEKNAWMLRATLEG